MIERGIINMMKFEKTEYCDVSERIRIVGKELLYEYPSLEVDDVMKIASLCDIVSNDVDEDVIFRRYYYILFVINNKNIELSKNVYSDMKKYCKGCLKDNLNKYLYDDIEKYYDGVIDVFPKISDYYGDV